MSNRSEAKFEASPEQMRYASILEKGMYTGLLILLITFAIYALGILDPYIPHAEISRYWAANVHEYLQQADIRGGWHWVSMLNYGDFINYIGIALLAGTTIICYLSIIPILLSNKDRIYATLALVEVVILCLAASGVLTVGH